VLDYVPHMWALPNPGKQEVDVVMNLNIHRSQGVEDQGSYVDYLKSGREHIQ